MSIEIERNIESRKETDRIMWFSMWVLLSVATFGIIWFLMIYLLIKRRNAHFSRQEKLETLILNKAGQSTEEKPLNYDSALGFAKKNPTSPPKNAQIWALSTILIVPAFYVFYFLITDLQKHEEHEREFFMKNILPARYSGLSADPSGPAVTKKFAFNKYLVLSVITCGFAAVYWLYRIFNDYNKHFKKQWKLEDDVLRQFKKTED